MATCSFEGIKFFEESVCLFRDGATATATSNTTNAKEILTNDRRTLWESIGSDDTTTETIEITFPATETINRVYLGGNNFKNFNIKYNDTGTWEDIVLSGGVDGAYESTELVYNNTFTIGTGGLDNWDEVGGGTITQSADTPDTSISYSVHWQNAINWGNIRQEYWVNGYSTTTGQTYKATVWLKGDNGATMSLTFRTGDDSAYINLATFTITNTWKKYTFFYDETAGGDNAGFLLTAREVAGITDVYMALPSVKEYTPIDTTYYEFDDISTDKLQINCTTTQTVNAEKQLTSALAMTETGQFNLFPDVKSVKIDRNEDRKKTLGEKYLVQKGFKTRGFSIGFPAYFQQDDLDLMTSLFEREVPFYVWLCGGKYGSTYFKPIIEPFRLEDLITMQTRDNLANKYKNNYYKGGVNTTLKLIEVVG